ncbi:MAG: hypothetical protein H9W83_08870 [Leuconostoc sp.]|nr:hypothetical protein [Leuconostoc sp.]
MKLDNAMRCAEIEDLNAKVRQNALDLMDNVYFVGRVIDAMTGEIIPVGEGELFDLYLLPNRSTYVADNYTNLL